MSNEAVVPMTTAEHIAVTEKWAAHNYHPLPVVIASGDGAWVTDVEGDRYLDCLAGYSALNFGHSHPRLLAAAQRQLETLTLTSRAFYNDQLGLFAQELCEFTGKEMMLPMNTGAEAVETALKVARRWGHTVKGVDPKAGSIITMHGNFHGRTTTIISFSDDEEATRGYGPYTPGFVSVDYGDIDALKNTVRDDTIAVLFEPIQGEGGVVMPPEGWLTALREVCDSAGILMMADEIQSGLGRTGQRFACDREGVEADIWIMGKALGGGVLPVSAITADRDVLGVITPGSHGSTFGGNPLAAAVGREVLAILREGDLLAHTRELGEYLSERLSALPASKVRAVRVAGLWAGIDLRPEVMTGRALCEALLERKVLAKDTHGSTIRLAPPLVVERAEIDLLCDALEDALA